MFNSDLTVLMEFIKTGFPFTPERYPNGDLSTSEKIRAFAVRHSAVHIAKTCGQIAAEAERYDHGGTMDTEQLKVATTKMLINVLNLANALGMTPEELAQRVPKVMR